MSDPFADPVKIVGLSKSDPVPDPFTEELDFLSAEDKDWIMGRAIVTRLG